MTKSDTDRWIEIAKKVARCCSERLGDEYSLSGTWTRTKVMEATSSYIQLEITTKRQQRFTIDFLFYTITNVHQDFAVCTITFIDLHPAMWRFRIHSLPADGIAITGCADFNEHPRYAAIWWSAESTRHTPCELCRRTGCAVYQGYGMDNIPLGIYRCLTCRWIPCGTNERVY